MAAPELEVQSLAEDREKKKPLATAEASSRNANIPWQNWRLCSDTWRVSLPGH